jgi:hypothetical protein
MDPKRSKVLIMDAVSLSQPQKVTFAVLIKIQVLPSTDISLSQAMGDHSMLTFGGKERSEREWRNLLESVGLVIEHIYKGPEPEAIIECRQAICVA